MPSPEHGGVEMAARNSVGGEMAANDNVGSKRHRRPNIRLGDIGGSDGGGGGGAGGHSSLNQRKLKNKASGNRHSLNLSSNHNLLSLVKTNPNVEEEDTESANLDDVAIGNWKVKDLKSKKAPLTKKMRSGWTPKAKDGEKDHKMPSTDAEILKRKSRVSEEGPTDDSEAQDLNCASERNGVKVWLNQLGLGQYASMFEIHEVDDEVLPMLTLEDLKEMGINAVGSRRKILCAIQNLNKGFS